jgi:hypothetical protein
MNLYWTRDQDVNLRRFELRAGDDRLASLDFAGPSGSRATAQAGEDTWLFQQVGFWKPRVNVQEAGDPDILASYRPGWFGSHGTLELRSGRRLLWRYAGWCLTQGQFEDLSGRPLVVFSSDNDGTEDQDLVGIEALMQIKPNDLALAELSLLVILGWYLLVLKRDDPAYSFRL